MDFILGICGRIGEMLKRIYGQRSKQPLNPMHKDMPEIRKGASSILLNKK